MKFNTNFATSSPHDLEPYTGPREVRDSRTLLYMGAAMGDMETIAPTAPSTSYDRTVSPDKICSYSHMQQSFHTSTVYPHWK